MQLPTRVILWVIGCIVLAGGVLVIKSGVELVRVEGRLTLISFALISAALVVCLIGLRIIVGFGRTRPEDEDDEPAW